MDAADLQDISIGNKVLPVQQVGQRPAHIFAVLNVHAAGLVNVCPEIIIAAFLDIFHIVDGYPIRLRNGPQRLASHSYLLVGANTGKKQEGENVPEGRV